ncbi:hypothetical protein PGTUg99_029306 [Puccinia graminis f. sp. tritici]|uniref:Uncharacterized protein n=1 Tax=Puccinia graminis f. sp. tritici TaxID=56615 RepID=A0A5B0RMP2_PUCGR|nr:hypothetical protein PGTUg99_029306 [Puccinia graminis f. sp. tritici]
MQTRGSVDMEDYQPDGGQKMANLFDSVMSGGAGQHAGYKTIKATHVQKPTSAANKGKERAATEPLGSTSHHQPALISPISQPNPSISSSQPKYPPPHIPQLPSTAPLTRPQATTTPAITETDDERDFRLAEFRLKQNKMVSSTV